MGEAKQTTAKGDAKATGLTDAENLAVILKGMADAADVSTASTVQIVPVSYTDKAGKKGQSIVMDVDRDSIQYVAWDNWLSLSKVIARAASDPEFGFKVAKVLQTQYIEYCGRSNGTRNLSRGDGLL